MLRIGKFIFFVEHLTTRFLSTSVCQALWRAEKLNQATFCLQGDYSLVTKQKTIEHKNIKPGEQSERSRRNK